MMKSIKQTLKSGAIIMALSLVFTSCDDILGEWDKPAPAEVTPAASVAVTSITLDQTTATINVGETLTLNVTAVAPDNATDKTVTWSSSASTIASVDASTGVVTAVAVGSVTITATANDGSGVEAICTVIVKTPGLLTGKFTINASDDQVQFSQGNLQYQASTQTWRFAENQYDYVGNAVGNTTSTGRDSQADWIDLFGWGTAGHSFASGYGEYYQPWATDNSDDTKYGPTDGTSSLTGTYAQGDWGTNAISNGGKTPSSWRTLTKDEWVYLFNTRSATTVNGEPNARYAKAKLFDTTYGVILFPDSYTHPDGVADPKGINKTDNTSWEANKYSAADWAKMETAGCVFLPAAGSRYGTTVSDAGTKGIYWSSSLNGTHSAYNVYFESNLLMPANYSYRYAGVSVRLVRDVK